MHAQDIAVVLEFLRRRLAEEGIPFAVIGALALRQYGLVRATEDIDILTTPEGLEKIHATLVGRGLAPRGAGLRKLLRKTEHEVNIDVMTSGEHAGSDDSPIVYPPPDSDAFVEIDGVRFPTMEALVEFKSVESLSLEVCLAPTSLVSSQDSAFVRSGALIHWREARDRPEFEARLKHRWGHFIKQVYRVDPLLCPRCGTPRRIIAFVGQPAVIEKILTHLGLWPAQVHGPPASAAAASPRLGLRAPPGRPSARGEDVCPSRLLPRPAPPGLGRRSPRAGWPWRVPGEPRRPQKQMLITFSTNVPLHTGHLSNGIISRFSSPAS